MINWVPLLLLDAGSSRHLPDLGLRSVPLDCGCHTWLAAPVQVHTTTAEWFDRPSPPMFMHLPSARRVPSDPRVHCCAPVPLQSHSWTAVPSAVFEWSTSTHLPAMPTIGAAPPGAV